MSETLQQLLQRIPRDDVMDALVRLNLADEDGTVAYRRVMDFLDETEPASASSISSVVVSMYRDDDGQPFGDVSGIESGYDGKVAIEFTPWDQWLPAMVVRGDGAECLGDDELVAHILWEMTWISPDPDEIAKKYTALVASIDKLKNELAS